MANKVRFFIDKNEFVDTEIYDIPIPQLKSIVWLHDEPLRVRSIAYTYATEKDSCNKIDVQIEHMEDENF